jgi:hypothetical protein
MVVVMEVFVQTVQQAMILQLAQHAAAVTMPLP